MEKLNLLNLSDHGTFQPSGQFASAPEEVDALFAHLAQARVGHIVLYFHGGLVSEPQGLATAETLLGNFAQAPGVHPLFVVWESGWQEVASRNVAGLSQTTFYQKLMEITLKFVLAKLEGGGRGAALDLAEPEVLQGVLADQGRAYDLGAVRTQLTEVTPREEAQFRAYLMQDAAFRRAAADATAALVQGKAKPTLPSGEAREKMKEDAAEGRGFITSSAFAGVAAKVFGRVVLRLIRHTDHGIYCTTVEEILRACFVDSVGVWLWDGIKKQAEEAFAPNDGLYGAALHGGTYFLAKLRDYIADPAHPRLQVSLIGHSAGGIYICHTLAKAAEMLPPTFKFSNVILLAPGCDFDLFKACVVDHANRLERFRLFDLRDEAETQDAMLPGVYPRSLLYFVSGVLEGEEPKPLVGMQRFYSGEPPYTAPEVLAGREFVLGPASTPTSAGRVIWAPAEENALPGRRSGAFGHGHFSDPLTWESIMNLLTY